MKEEVLKLYQRIKMLFPRKSPIFALRLAVLKVKMLESLKNGFSYFTYRKECGEIRETIATLDEKVKPSYEFKGGSYGARNEAVLVTAWDTAKSMWRTFRVDRVVRLHV